MRIGQEFCEALGLDPMKVSAIVIKVTPTGAVARVTIPVVQGGELSHLLERYKLAPWAAGDTKGQQP